MSNFHLYPDHICIRKKILYAPWAFHALADELYDVGITYIAMLRRSVELCLAGRLLHFFQKNFQKRRVKRARDRSETVVLTEREKTTYSPRKGGDNDGEYPLSERAVPLRRLL